MQRLQRLRQRALDGKHLLAQILAIFAESKQHVSVSHCIASSPLQKRVEAVRRHQVQDVVLRRVENDAIEHFVLHRALLGLTVRRLREPNSKLTHVCHAK